MNLRKDSLEMAFFAKDEVFFRKKIIIYKERLFTTVETRITLGPAQKLDDQFCVKK